MGSFIALYGIDNSRRLIAEALGERRRLGREDRATAGVEERPFGGIAFGRDRQRLIARCRESGLLFIGAIPVVRRELPVAAKP